jgi:hypothetical protein
MEEKQANNQFCLNATTLLSETPSSGASIGGCRMTSFVDSSTVLSVGQTATIWSAMTATTEKIVGDLVARAAALIDEARRNQSRVEQQHNDEWRRLHDNFGIWFDVGASLRLKQAVNSSIVYLLSALREDYHESVRYLI